MSSQRKVEICKRLSQLLVSFIGMMFLASCGVKGDPLPPEKPVELGRGRPNYRRATQGLKVKRSNPDASVYEESDEKKEDTDN